MPILQTTDLKKYYGDEPNITKALDGVSLSVELGEFVAIVGTSGSGKSTLLNMIGGLDVPTSGKVIVDGKDLSTLKDEQLTIFRRRKIGYIYQNYNLVPVLNVYENIVLPVELDGDQVDKKYMQEVVRMLGLEDKLNNMPNNLSGGQQQRVAIARAIVNEPKVLLLDEPLGALDLKLRQDMQYELIRLKNELGITFIYVTHDQEEALTMSDTIVVMNQGYIQQIGTPEDIYNEPENAFVADFIGDSNIFDAVMVQDKLVQILGAKFACVDTGFGTNKPVDAVIRPEDVELVAPENGTLQGVVTHLIFKGVHYEMEVTANGFEWLVHSTGMFPVGTAVGIRVDPFNIQIMHKPESEDEEAVAVDE